MQNGVQQFAVLLMPGVLLTCAAGCGWSVRPPPVVPGDGTKIYLLTYGIHTSLVLPEADGRLREYTIADWDWFARGHTQAWDALRAMFCSTGSTLGRRDFSGHQDPASLKREAKANGIEVLHVNRRRALALTHLLDQQYASRAATETYSKSAKMECVRSDAPYSLIDNCNHHTADWLDSLGCEIHGFPLLANVRLLPPQPVSEPASPQPAVASR